jgi:holdfast attachment protein HfaA
MTMTITQLLIGGIALSSMTACVGTAQAGDYSNATNYNNPFGMSAAQENAPVNSSLRDANGNLTVVNGQITSAFGGVGNVQSSTGVGYGGSGTSGTATAIGNSLNVVTTGSNNIVIVDANQTNNGNQTANSTVSGQ